MKNIKHYLTIIFVIIVNINIYGQTSANKVNDTAACFNIPCNPNTFWLKYYLGPPVDSFRIAEYTLVNNTISLVTLNKTSIAPYSPNLALVNLEYPSACRTFYDLDTSYLRRFNTNLNNWDTINVNLNFPCGSMTGNDNFIVAAASSPIASGGWEVDLVRLKYNNLNQIADTIIYPWNPNEYIITQLAIDNLNQIWFFDHIGNSSGYWVATNLRCIDEMGNLIHDYPLNFYCDLFGAHGMFIMNNKIYVGTDASNGPSPTDLIPFAIINDTVVREPPINFIAPTNRKTMATCINGSLVSVNEIPSALKDLSVYPNPASSNFTVYLPYKTSAQAQIKVVNSQGQLIYSSAAINYNTINCSTWSRGVYLVNLQENGKIITSKKIVLE